MRATFGEPALDYEQPPRRFAWGADATLYEFSLCNAPEACSGPLVLRLFPVDVPPERAARETATQGVLSKLGYPVPAAPAFGTLGEDPPQAFVVMERIQGHTFMDVAMAACGVALLASVFGFHLGWLAVGALYLGVMVRWMRRLHGLPRDDVVAAMTGAGFDSNVLRFEARLAHLESRAAGIDAGGLGPGFAWLQQNRPTDAPEVLCHGDFWPGNVLCGARGITGIIDWGDAALAPREYELAWSLVAFYSGLPTAGPPWLASRIAAGSRPVVWCVLSLYRNAYRAIQPLDPDRMRYFVAFHCLRALVFAGERLRLPDAALHPWTAPRVIRLLEQRFRRLTGVEVALGSE